MSTPAPERDLTHWPRYMVHNGDQRTAELRGIEVFNTWAGQGLNAGSGVWVPVTHPHHHMLLFIATPSEPAIADHIAELAACRHCAVVVDVFFPITRLDAVVGNFEAMAYWTDPGRRAAGLRALRSADVVSTPWPQCGGCPDWLDMLSDLNPNVVILPDTNRVGVAEFGETLEGAWRLGWALKATR